MFGNTGCRLVSIVVGMTEGNIAMLANRMSNALFGINCFNNLVPTLGVLFGFESELK
jgi:hypothetical protein